eukprot:scaffold16628_cov78-Phaeocystis_antarctica.AAC.4
MREKGCRGHGETPSYQGEMLSRIWHSRLHTRSYDRCPERERAHQESDRLQDARAQHARPNQGALVGFLRWQFGCSGFWLGMPLVKSCALKRCHNLCDRAPISHSLHQH